MLGVAYQTGYTVQTTNGEYQANAVLLATGAPRATVPSDGLTRLEGKGVSYCAICDAFFFRGKTVAVLGNGEYAAH